MTTIQDLLVICEDFLSDADQALVRRAYDFAERAHGSDLRKSGDRYIEHPLVTAIELANLELDAQTIAAGLLHDVPEDTAVSMQEVEDNFGPEIAYLVDGVTKLGKYRWGQGEDANTPPAADTVERATGQRDFVIPRLPEERDLRAETLRKLLLSATRDPRVIFIKLADRLHNLHTLGYLPEHKQKRIAQETLEIYAPLAHRIGMWEFKWQLEDMAFYFLDPDEYSRIASSHDLRRHVREDYIRRATLELGKALHEQDIQAEFSGRAKHIYSTYRKMQRKGRDVEHIYDLVALRVIVPTVRDCYTVLGVVHSLWQPIPGEFDDYIAMPKENGYQSLHTSVIAFDGKSLEIQIRTPEMHREAERGMAAHWRYKTRQDADSDNIDRRLERDHSTLEQLASFQAILESRQDMDDAQEFVDSIKSDFFQDTIHVFTPKGDVKEMPTGSTPIDFAYHVHTEVGHHCRGARVNGNMVTLNHRLTTGDRVEIIISKSGGPSRDWLNPNLGYIRTAHARQKIRAWFRRQERPASITQGRDLLDRELRRLSLVANFAQVTRALGYEESHHPDPDDPLVRQRQTQTLERLGFCQEQIDELVAFFRRYDNLDDLYIAINHGNIAVQDLAIKFLPRAEDPFAVLLPPPPKPTVEGVRVEGVSGLSVRLGQCCNPLPGNDVVGYVTKHRVITIHRRDCSNVLRTQDRERLLEVDWGVAAERLFPVAIRVRAVNRHGLLRDISMIVASERVSMTDIHTLKDPEAGLATLAIIMEVSDIKQLSRLTERISKQRGVMDVWRDTGQATAPGGRPSRQSAGATRPESRPKRAALAGSVLNPEV
ncbi:MAG: bifunctional (p)ppGpp synthetase/guanosine-3',5'-bis(diphosphate) 3'-pyrophosphohydrolase [Chloroflexi bacterium]|nr:bifunctional (p)ppGpp synthetase/guanosine-3',5'-bis(diphosphate) 3'-pyrophosphohydrolase [Chloroflexota bacterium]MBU1749089.1 bifunctional (p)ppGpp synthetase/guanosine-3',5'-bis(diphosphate) 3'-pyrophosphohydrolase [Chloroflexota bacterium]